MTEMTIDEIEAKFCDLVMGEVLTRGELIETEPSIWTEEAE